MRQKPAVLMAPVFCVLLGLVAAAQQQEESQLSIERSWATKILKASHPDSVTIRRPKEVEIPPPDERNELPRENQQWLVLGWLGRGLNEVMLLCRSPYTDETKLTTESGSPSEVSLLFSLAATIEPIYLQIGQGVKVPVLQ